MKQGGRSLLCAALSYYVLQGRIRACEGNDSVLAKALGRDLKGKGSIVLYVGAIALAFVSPWIAHAIYVLVAIIWLVPDVRIERALREDHSRRQ